MDKAKFFNILLLALLMSLVIQFMFPPEKSVNQNTQDIILSIKDDSVTIPNIPSIEVINNTTGSVMIYPCKDIKITIDSRPLSMSGVDQQFCTQMEVISGSASLLPISKLYRVFAELSGKYTLSLVTPLGERIVPFTISEPGSIRSLLSVLVYQPIYNLFVALLTFLPGHSLGWAIIIVTLIVRLILLVPQHHMLMSQKKLQTIQPKIKALQKEYKNDSATLGMKMLELYKKEDVNPFGAFVPLLIQMPILIGLYWVISEINDPSNFYHLYRFFSEFNPTAIATYFYGLHLDSVGGTMGIVLGGILGITQWLQAYMSMKHTKKHESKKEIEEKKEGEAPEIALDPEVMQKMMLYFFPIMIAVTSYFFPLGVGLYWFIGTLFVIVQQWYVNSKKK
ncbi:membrane protein insertase YidC [Candidatus Gracilibacteria bacterium]|nr:membrane protein insertase YidC [Candidatus Gracilibacteria bacterium]